jgi:hypothetical protein
MPTRGGGERKNEQILVRVTSRTYALLQLAQPFVRRRSMQDLVAAIIEDFLDGLRDGDPGYRKAVAGLQETEARRQGVLAQRTTHGHATGK